MSGFPIVRIELERMQHSIMVALGQALEAEKQTIETLLEKELKDFDFRSLVRQTVHQELRAALNDAIKNSVSRVFFSDDVRREMDRLLLHEMQSVLRVLANQLEASRNG